MPRISHPKNTPGAVRRSSSCKQTPDCQLLQVRNTAQQEAGRELDTDEDDRRSAEEVIGSPPDAVPHGPALCVGSTQAWTAPVIFEPRCLAVLGPCAR